MMNETTDTAHMAMMAYTALRMKKLSIVGRIYVGKVACLSAAAWECRWSRGG